MRIHDDTMKIHDLQNDIIPLVVTVKPEHGDEDEKKRRK